ncbi:hypothetical protein B9Y60_10630 [Stenotrophomonas maltophilia]|uniref:murein L,D-transpeptidase catalytic domain-containing protein n=1 Tax=Stenotrophomonas maltophilia TaxID=40324 RepID=UPI000C261FB2|nr:murein L,D-transpeptidase catalytic domain family protein [Stenotrophomonas maltophilia]PJL52210.1 hypothetical protein B9Y73_10630 [Stenotrophomonas maltophilia]PJL55131.1 hypothetical protein B9Y60_10630 [Stenotrophomonas maltophilia]
MKRLALSALLFLTPSLAFAGSIWPSNNAEARAIQATACAIQKGLSAPRVLVVIDMTQKRNEKRLKAFDLSSGQLITQDYVAHGRGSGAEALKFSNQPGSLATSVGLYRVAEKYRNTTFNDWRRRLDGLSMGLNDRARERAVVLHPAAYVRPGAVGRSEGCPAVRTETLQTLEQAGLDDALIWIDSESQATQLEASLDCGVTVKAWDKMMMSCPAPSFNFGFEGWVNG